MANNSIKLTVTRSTAASADTILSLIADWKNLPIYWHGMRTIKKDEGGILIAKFAFPGHAQMRYVVDVNRKTSEEIYLGGPFKGFKRLSIHTEDGDGSEMTAVWEIKLTPLLRLASDRMTEHLKTGTEHALERISEEAEKRERPTD